MKYFTVEQIEAMQRTTEYGSPLGSNSPYRRYYCALEGARRLSSRQNFAERMGFEDWDSYCSALAEDPEAIQQAVLALRPAPLKGALGHDGYDPKKWARTGRDYLRRLPTHLTVSETRVYECSAFRPTAGCFRLEADQYQIVCFSSRYSLVIRDGITKKLRLESAVLFSLSRMVAYLNDYQMVAEWIDDL